MALTHGTGTYIAMAFMLMLSLPSPIGFGGTGALTPLVEAGAGVRLTTAMAGVDIPVIGAVVTGVAAGAVTGDITIMEVIIPDTIPDGVAVAIGLVILIQIALTVEVVIMEIRRQPDVMAQMAL